MKHVIQTLEGMRFGTEKVYKNLVMLPLLAEGLSEPDYLLLDEAIQAGCAKVTEVSASGSVPTLKFTNSGEKAVLLLDGEELVGAKQNRILNVTVFAAAMKTINLPVSCVEAGRWHSVSNDFMPSPQVHFAKGRAMKSVKVAASLAHDGSRDADQGEIWSEISLKEERMSARSDTSAMADLYKNFEGSVSEFVEALQPVEGQLGALFAIGGHVVGMDLFDCRHTLTKLLPKLVRSYALDALESQAIPSKAFNLSDVQKFITALSSAKAEVFPSVGEGEEVRLAAHGLTAAALVARDRVVHLSAFNLVAVADSTSGGSGSNVSPPSVRRHLRYTRE